MEKRLVMMLGICGAGLMITSAGAVVWGFVLWTVGVPMVSVGLGTAIGAGIVAGKALGVYDL